MKIDTFEQAQEKLDYITRNQKRARERVTDNFTAAKDLVLIKLSFEQHKNVKEEELSNFLGFARSWLVEKALELDENLSKYLKVKHKFLQLYLKENKFAEQFNGEPGYRDFVTQVDSLVDNLNTESNARDVLLQELILKIEAAGRHNQNQPADNGETASQEYQPFSMTR